MIDTGSDVSCWPQVRPRIKNATNFVLSAANGSSIKTYGSKVFSINLGLRRDFKWSFIIADVSKPIIGADFLQHFGLIVDIKRKILIDPLTSLTSSGHTSRCSLPVIKSISGNSKFHKLLEEFKIITQPSILSRSKIKHSTLHFIHTSGPPV